MKLLFVCTGNVCRSLMAERLARRLAEAGVESAPHVPQLVSRPLEDYRACRKAISEALERLAL